MVGPSAITPGSHRSRRFARPPFLPTGSVPNPRTGESKRPDGQGSRLKKRKKRPPSLVLYSAAISPHENGGIAMSAWSETLSKLESQKDICFDLLRIYLGIGLFVKGILFLTDMEALSSLLMKSEKFQPITFLISHYIPIAHIGGGLMMALGLW